jgi:hypothetical protein
MHWLKPVGLEGTHILGKSKIPTIPFGERNLYSLISSPACYDGFNLQAPQILFSAQRGLSGKLI